MPNFLIGGVSAGGTSFLAAALCQHPEIYFPKNMRPEPHYFFKSWEFAKPIAYYQEKYFSEVNGQKAIGEMSSSYLFGGSIVAERIHSIIPQVKLIFSLRNPIERTYANYRYTVLSGLDDLDFEQALRQEKQQIKHQKGIWAEIQPLNYTGRGFYAKQLTEYLEYFDRSQILVLKSEDVGKNHTENFKKIFRFLEVDENFVVQIPPNFTSLSVKDPALQKRLRTYFGDRFSELVESVRREDAPEGVVVTEEDRRMFKLFKNNIKEEKEPMPESCRKYLQEVFREDMSALKGLVDFSIDDWK